jgi:2-C-methyl-D-erythritol 4-phosphate cytidylyltransferase
MKKFAVIVAGGSGQRMGGSTPKQFLLLHGKPVLFYTIQRFQSAFDDITIVIVLPETHLTSGHELLKQHGLPGKIIIVRGGESRFASVKNGLKHVSNDSIVFVHDGVRCLVSPDLIQRCYFAALDHGNAIPAVKPRDSIRLGSTDHNLATDRDSVYLVQTPQTFKSGLLLAAFEQDFRPAFTDEATVLESAGHRIHLVEGETTNLKITLPADLIFAERLLEGT